MGWWRVWRRLSEDPDSVDPHRRFSIGKSSTNGSFFQSCYSYVSLLKGAILDAFNGSKPLLPTTWKWPRYASADAEEAGRWLLRSGEATGRHRTHLHLGIQQVGGPPNWGTCTLRKWWAHGVFSLMISTKNKHKLIFQFAKCEIATGYPGKFRWTLLGKTPVPLFGGG